MAENYLSHTLLFVFENYVSIDGLNIYRCTPTIRILWHVNPLLGSGSANTFPWRRILGNQPVTGRHSRGYGNGRCFRGDWFLETIYRWVTNRRFLGYEMERYFLCRSVPKSYNRKPISDYITTRVEVDSNTSTVTLRVVGGDEKIVSKLRQ
jgi:hypothetical protein